MYKRQVQDAMTDYDRNWCKDMEDFFGRYTTNLINETSMKPVSYTHLPARWAAQSARGWQS